MSYSKSNLFLKAIEIVTAYAGSAGQTTSLDVVLEEVYKKLEEINEKIGD
ncbi:MAG: hypothetical protein PHD49_00175 [Candidatus Shapirobacteria bacterium]|nr:hypothetical protein [Candidatus Shapirobacteria bacterium]